MENNEVINDFRRRYENTYVWLTMNDCKEETLVHVDQIADDRNKMAVLSLTSSKYGQMTVNFGSADHTLRFKYPPVGVFQHGTHAMCFMRRPSRQYRRGLCADNSFMDSVDRHVTGRVARWSIDEVESAFRHQTHGLATALTMLGAKTQKGVALGDEYSITRSMTADSKSHILWHWMDPVARITSTGKLDKLLESMYEEEVLMFTEGVTT